MKVGDVIGRWTLLYEGRNAAGNKVFLCQCRCLVIRELLVSDLVPSPCQSRVWLCGHRVAPKPRPKFGKTSIYRGVSDDEARCLSRPWRVAVSVDGVHCYIGRFSDEVEAAKAYDRAALALWGPTAILNFPKEKEGAIA